MAVGRARVALPQHSLMVPAFIVATIPNAFLVPRVRAPSFTTSRHTGLRHPASQRIGAGRSAHARALPATAARSASNANSPAAGKARRLPGSAGLRALRLAGIAATLAVAVVSFRSAPRLVGASRSLPAMGVAVALQCASVVAAVETATKGTKYRGALLWLHAVLSVLSFGSLAVAMVHASTALPRAVRASLVLAATVTSWAVLNGTVAFVDLRRYPAPLKGYLTEAYGSVPRGKSLFMKYHRTVGAMAFSFTVLSVCLAMSSLPVEGQVAVPAAIGLAFAAAAALGPSLSFCRYPLPRVSATRAGGISVVL